jgi:imidazolonepropionase-like amidohydrolase
MRPSVLQRLLGVITICTLVQALSAQTPRSPHHIVLAASTVLDGKGHILRNTRIVVEDSTIVALDPKAAPVDYDLRGMTVLPGWIDAHVHLAFSFDKSGKAFATSDPQEIALHTASNAWVTLMAGFTTVQSMGSPAEVHVRDAIMQGLLPGPRILSAIEPLTGQGEKTGTPNEIRAYIRKQKGAGADFIKIYAAGGMRQGEMTMSQEQLDAACDEAKNQGLRTLVHAYREAVRAAALAGCSQDRCRSGRAWTQRGGVHRSGA